MNLHVPKSLRQEDSDALLPAFVDRRRIPGPWVGLLTAAWTERAQVAGECLNGVTALAIVTVGLSNRVAAGTTPVGVWAPSTINAIIVVDAAPDPAALVNTVMTVTEVKTSLLAAADLRCADGHVASGTSTDAIVVAATGRGPRQRFGGPISDLGWVVGRASRAALRAGIQRWIEEHP